jgi:hypothetical protein
MSQKLSDIEKEEIRSFNTVIENEAYFLLSEKIFYKKSIEKLLEINDLIDSPSKTYKVSLKELNSEEALLWIQSIYQSGNIKIKKGKYKLKQIITIINSINNDLNKSFNVLVDSIRNPNVKYSRAVSNKAFRTEAEKTAFNNYISIIRKINKSVTTLYSQVKERKGKLTADIYEVGNLSLACIAYYISNVTKIEMPNLYYIALNGGINDRLSKSDLVIILVTRYLLRFIKNYNLEYFENKKSMIDSFLLSNKIYDDMPNKISDRLKSIDSLSGDWENNLLKMCAYIFPEMIRFNRTNQKKSLVINNGVVSKLPNLGIHICTLGNQLDGWKNPKCKGKDKIINRNYTNINAKFKNVYDVYNVTKINKIQAKIEVKLNIGKNRNINLYTPSSSKRLGVNNVIASLTNSDLEAANVAKNAFACLINEDDFMKTVPRTDKTKREFTRLNVLLNTEFLDEPIYNNIRKNKGSLFSRFYGCFLAKTTGDTSQYIEANLNTTSKEYIFKLDNDRPAWVGDLIFRACVKKEISNSNKNSSESALVRDYDTLWCGDYNYSDVVLGRNKLQAWKMIFMVDTFHDYGYGNMSERFGTSIEYLKELLRKQQKGGSNSYRTEKRRRISTPQQSSDLMNTSFSPQKEEIDYDYQIESIKGEIIDCILTYVIMIKINTYLNEDVLSSYENKKITQNDVENVIDELTMNDEEDIKLLKSLNNFESDIRKFVIEFNNELFSKKSKSPSLKKSYTASRVNNSIAKKTKKASKLPPYSRGLSAFRTLTKKLTPYSRSSFMKSII